MSNTYSSSIPESPYQESLIDLVQKIEKKALLLNEDDSGAIKNALYFSVEKRVSVCFYDGDDVAYLEQLLLALSSAKNEFDQVCYENSKASDVFFKFEVLLCNPSNK